MSLEELLIPCWMHFNRSTNKKLHHGNPLIKSFVYSISFIQFSIAERRLRSENLFQKNFSISIELYISKRFMSGLELKYFDYRSSRMWSNSDQNAIKSCDFLQLPCRVLIAFLFQITGNTPLMLAVKDNKTPLIDRLIELGSDVCARNNVSSWVSQSCDFLRRDSLE